MASSLVLHKFILPCMTFGFRSAKIDTLLFLKPKSNLSLKQFQWSCLQPMGLKMKYFAIDTHLDLRVLITNSKFNAHCLDLFE